jgi:methyltransferase
MAELRWLAVVLAAVFIPMLVEAARAARNERAQRARGGIEPEGDVYAIMRIAYPAAFLAMIVEGALRGWPTPAAMAAGAGVFVAAKALKWRAILALGPSWTFRVLVVPGMPRVTSGPYRLMRHPNYVAVLGEFLAVAVMTGAVVAGPVATLTFGALIARRIAIERRALDAILRRN